MRIVSLLPSSTEIVCALGLESSLVGRSHECDFPAGIDRLPALTAPKFNPDGRSYEVNQRVKAILQEAVAVYKIDAEKLRELAPDFIVTQSQCDVCAVSFDEVCRVAEEFLGTSAEIISLEPNALADIFTDIQRVADALNVSATGIELVQSMKARMRAIEEETMVLSYRPTVVTIEWIDPIMAGGNWMPTLVEMAGGINLFGRAGAHSPWLEWHDIVRANPDKIVILPCGYDIATTQRELSALTDRPEWQSLKAVQDHAVYLTDGNQYFNRPGPRIVDSLEILAEILHPELFNFGFEGKGWITY